MAACLIDISPEGQVGEEGDGQEDGRDSTADVGDEGEDGGLHTAGDGLPEDVLREPCRIMRSEAFMGLGGISPKNKRLLGNDCAPTSRIAKLVKWLQLQRVSVAVLFIM